MINDYLYAQARLRRWGPDARDRLLREGVAPTFAKDEISRFDEPVGIALQFDAETDVEAAAQLTRALGPEARLVLPSESRAELTAH